MNVRMNVRCIYCNEEDFRAYCKQLQIPIVGVMVGYVCATHRACLTVMRVDTGTRKAAGEMRIDSEQGSSLADPGSTHLLRTHGVE